VVGFHIISGIRIIIFTERLAPLLNYSTWFNAPLKQTFVGAASHAVAVHLSINSLDNELARKLEPRAASPKMRLAAVEALAKASVPVGVLGAPVIPALNDHEIPSVLTSAKAAGAGWAYTEILRLPPTVAPIFE